MKFIHSADWQIGARFRQFGEKAEALRAARVRTLRRALEYACDAEADFFLIAGDLFEDDQVAPATVREVFELLADFREMPIYIVPGNHDPFTGPGCIWARAPFNTPLEHVHVCTTPATHEIAGGVLLANPLSQKKSTIDPSLRLAELAAAAPTGAIKVGLTHGSPDIGSQIPRDDFPIALDAATRAGLDFLALGHWHGARTFDGGRMWMPGTPEPTDFSEHNAGSVLEVEIAHAGALPRVRAVPVAECHWRDWKLDGDAADADRTAIDAALAALDLTRVVARITLTGPVAPGFIEEQTTWLRARLAECVVADIRDETTLEFSAAALEGLPAAHPLLADVLATLHRGALPAAELASISEATGIPVQHLDPLLMHRAGRLLLRTLREVGDAA